MRSTTTGRQHLPGDLLNIAPKDRLEPGYITRAPVHPRASPVGFPSQAHAFNRLIGREACQPLFMLSPMAGTPWRAGDAADART